ncbi:HNH endonuclease signature motif containing protein [Nocardioides coralli]|uniref:HNH endonuclease signature motif containing protein n=1 Tax=Nocardioides coralli TaxID=2872154 RepID=UPI001CA3ADD4|nr:HNH endonuclease signature motif containing protein [Nocardioides coralli]QZY29514.1 HNH endonuclease [Nocardioides coralli]
MTAVLDLHPAPGHPAALVAAVHEALDDVRVDGLGPEELAGTIAELSRARSRLHALELRLVAAAERSSVARDAGCASTGAWLSRQTRSGTAAASREVKLAADLNAKLPATQAALGAGEVSTEHAAVIAHATQRLPGGLSADQVATVEQRLVEQARRVDPGQLRRLARRALQAVERDTTRVDAHENAQLVDEETRALAKTRLTLHDNGDGTLSGHFTVPLVAGSVLKKVLDALTSPRRISTSSTGVASGSADTASGSTSVADRDWAHERGLAFSQLLEHLPTDRLHGKTAATVVVTLDLETLQGRLEAAGLDTGDVISASEARRLACGAGLVPAVLGGKSQPLDLGRANRFFSEAQRTAGALSHTSCTAEGCEVPYAWCELHHRQPWSQQGRTDLADMVPLCGFHHRAVHDPGHRHRRLPDGSIRFTRRT